MFDSIINYIIKVFDPGVIVIFIVVLYIYVSSLNKMMEVMVTKDDFDQLDKIIEELSTKITTIKASFDVINNQVSSSIVELDAQVKNLSEIVSELMEYIKEKK